MQALTNKQKQHENSKSRARSRLLYCNSYIKHKQNSKSTKMAEVLQRIQPQSAKAHIKPILGFKDKLPCKCVHGGSNKNILTFINRKENQNGNTLSNGFLQTSKTQNHTNRYEDAGILRHSSNSSLLLID